MEAECSGKAGESGDDTGSFPNDACYKYQWHMRQIGMPAAWKQGNGKGAVVAVIDTGVTKVGDLADTKFVAGYNFVANNANAADDHGHGTHVAGTIAESTNNKLGVAGVAYGATIMPLKVLSAQGSGSMGGISQSIRWAADHGANVINMSLGGGRSMAPMAKAIKYAHDKGVVVIAAAGNDGSGRVSYPARYPDVIAVAATQQDEATTFYSNWGPEVDLAAPGGNTRGNAQGGVLQHTIVPGDTKRTDYLWFMGTSMATPHVAGVAALVVGAGVKKPAAVEEILLSTARKPAGRNAAAGARIDDHYGAGIVDAAAALHKTRDARGGEELGLGLAAGLLGLAADAPARDRGSRARLRRAGGVRHRRLGARSDLGDPGLLVARARGGRRALGRVHRSLRRAAERDAGLQRRRSGPADAAALRRAPPAAGAGRLRLRRGGRAALRGDRPHRRPALRPRRDRALLARRPGGDRRPVRDGLPAQGVDSPSARSTGTAARVGGRRELAGDAEVGPVVRGIGPDRLVAHREGLRSRPDRALGPGALPIDQQAEPAATVAQGGRTSSCTSPSDVVRCPVTTQSG